jgi:putative peptidoglycan lipid II flippase
VTFRRLTFYTAIVGGGFVTSKFFGFARDILVARAFGTSGDLDAYYAAFNFPDLLFALIPGGALASVFIPVFSGYLVDPSKRDEGWKFASAVINDVFLIVALLAALALIAAPLLVAYVIAPGFDPARQELAADLMRLVLISTLVFSLSGVVTGILQAHNAFLLPALAPSLYNLGIIAGALFLAPRFGIYGLGYGVVIGSTLHLLIQVPGLVRRRARYFLTLGLRQAGLGELTRLFGPRLVTLGVVRLNNLLMTNLASHLAAGSIAGLNYAYVIWQFPESLFGTAIALAVFPTLSALAAQGAREQLRRTFNLTMFAILALAIPSVLLVIVFAQPLVRLAYERGEFTAASTQAVSGILQFYALAVIGESALELAARIFYAQHDSRTPMLIAIAAMILRAALMFAWANVWGARGLALAYAVGVSAEAGALYLLARRRLPGNELAQPSIASPPQMG